MYSILLCMYIQFCAAAHPKAQIWIKADSKNTAVKGLREIKYTKSEHALCKIHIFASPANDLIYKSEVT